MSDCLLGGLHPLVAPSPCGEPLVMVGSDHVFERKRVNVASLEYGPLIFVASPGLGWNTQGELVCLLLIRSWCADVLMCDDPPVLGQSFLLLINDNASMASCCDM